MIKYKTCFGRIEEAEITKETDKCVFKTGYRGRIDRENKESAYHKYHDTWEQARDYLIAECERNIYAVKKRLTELEANLEKIKTKEAPKP